VRGLADILQTIRDIAPNPLIGTMVLLAGAASFFIGNSYQAQMPSYAHDLGHGDAGVTYSMLLAADAAGALLAGLLLETRSFLRVTPRNAIWLAMLWCVTLAIFASVRSYPAALVLLFLAGVFELSFNSMAQTLVQLNAPGEIRGRVIGLYGMSALGLRAFSGVTVGLAGSIVGVHWSLVASALVMLAVLCAMQWRLQTTAVAKPSA
jgi:MFS family permease